MNLQVQVCAIKREHPVAVVNKHGRCTGTLNSDKAWGCCVPSTWAQCIPTGLAQCSDRTVAGMCRHLHEVKNAYVDTTSVRLSVTQCHRLNRLSDFREILYRSSSQKSQASVSLVTIVLMTVVLVSVLSIFLEGFG